MITLRIGGMPIEMRPDGNRASITTRHVFDFYLRKVQPTNFPHCRYSHVFKLLAMRALRMISGCKCDTLVTLFWVTQPTVW